MRSRICAAVFLVTLVLSSGATAQPLQGTASVIDGDTLEIHGQRIRLFGVDAPEGRQTCDRDGKAWRCGQQAALALADKIGRRPIACRERDRDRYRRIVAICYLDGEDLNGWLVRQGWALDYRQYSKGRYAAEEAEARSGRRGVWAGTFQKPWEWRRKRTTK
jgi:endonuclease YncB( thermonuclease family)